MENLIMTPKEAQEMLWDIEIVSLRKLGMTVKEITEKMKISEAIIHASMKRLGINKRMCKVISEDKLKEICELYLSSGSIEKTAKVVCFDVTIVSKLLKLLKQYNLLDCKNLSFNNLAKVLNHYYELNALEAKANEGDSSKLSKEKFMSEKDEQQIVDLLQQELSITKIAEITKFSRKRIKEISIKHNIDTDKMSTTLNKNYFEVIDSEEKAYLLGILFSIGSIHVKNERISFDLKPENLEILEILSQAVFGRNFAKIKTSTNEVAFAKLAINSSKMKNDLINWGRKIVIAESTLPKLSDDLEIHFVRGLFDISGVCDFSFDKNKYVISFGAVSENKVKFLKEFFEKHNFKHCITTSAIKISTRKTCVEFLKFIYKDANFFLKRKYEKCNQIYFERFDLDDAKRIIKDIDIVYYYNQGLAAWEIAPKVNLSKDGVLDAYKRIGVSGIKRKWGFRNIKTEKECRGCFTVLLIENFRKTFGRNGKVIIEPACFNCRDKFNKEQSKKDTEKYFPTRQRYYRKNKKNDK